MSVPAELDPTSCYDCGAPEGTDHTDNPTHDFWSVADAAAGSPSTFGRADEEPESPRPLLEVLEEHVDHVRAQRETHPAVARLAQMIADSGDFAAVLELRPILQGAAFNAVCIELDVCDVHLTDQDSCRDDGLGCPAGRAASKAAGR